MKEILPQIIGAVTNEYLADKEYADFLEFAKNIVIPDDVIIYLNTAAQETSEKKSEEKSEDIKSVTVAPVLNIAFPDENIVALPLPLLFNVCPEFAQFYSVATFEAVYTVENIAAFAIYFILDSYMHSEDPEEKESLKPLVKMAMKFIKPGNSDLDKVNSELA